MRFSFPCFPGEFEIPTEWWREAGMEGFTPTAATYLSTTATGTIPLRNIEPPVRFPECPQDGGGFKRESMVSVLRGISSGSDIEPVPLIVLPSFPEFAVPRPPRPFDFRVYNGYHRFYASVAAGFSCLPATVWPWPS
jgi:hypothetical protein